MVRAAMNERAILRRNRNATSFWYCDLFLVGVGAPATCLHDFVYPPNPILTQKFGCTIFGTAASFFIETMRDT